MKTSLQCTPCFARQILEAAAMSTDDPAVHEKIVAEALQWMSEMDLSLSPPVFAQKIHRRLRELTGNMDPYRKEKTAHNRLALEMLPALREQVKKSGYPLFTAANFAVAGNIIDLGVKTGLQEPDMLQAVEDAVKNRLEGDTEEFVAAAGRAQKILYLADNCGEIILDTLLIEQLGPERITVAVRGGPIINDATLEDAKEAGLMELVSVMDNGSDAPGTVLEDCSPKFRDVFETADLIIAKGQGNFETLSETDRPVFFLFKVKCPVVAKAVGMPIGAHVLRKRSADV